MSPHLIQIERSADSSRVARVYFDTDLGGYLVRFAHDGAVLPEADYYSDALPDAVRAAGNYAERSAEEEARA